MQALLVVVESPKLPSTRLDEDGRVHPRQPWMRRERGANGREIHFLFERAPQVIEDAAKDGTGCPQSSCAASGLALTELCDMLQLRQGLPTDGRAIGRPQEPHGLRMMGIQGVDDRDEETCVRHGPHFFRPLAGRRRARSFPSSSASQPS